MILAMLISTSVLALLALASYSLLVPWWESTPGKAYFSLFATITVIILHFVGEIGLDYSAPSWVELALILLVDATFIFNIFTFTREQITGYKDRRGFAYGAPTAKNPAPTPHQAEEESHQ